jgi:hypothetical protein
MYILKARSSDEERLRKELQDLVRAVNEKRDPDRIASLSRWGPGRTSSTPLSASS